MVGAYLVMNLGVLAVPLQYAIPLGILSCALISVAINYLFYRAGKK